MPIHPDHSRASETTRVAINAAHTDITAAGPRRNRSVDSIEVQIPRLADNFQRAAQIQRLHRAALCMHAAHPQVLRHHYGYVRARLAERRLRTTALSSARPSADPRLAVAGNERATFRLPAGIRAPKSRRWCPSRRRECSPHLAPSPAAPELRASRYCRSGGIPSRVPRAASPRHWRTTLSEPAAASTADAHKHFIAVPRSRNLERCSGR